MNVSVVMAVRDGERYLAEALTSVHAQTVAPLEILLVDGDSTDATREIAAAAGARVLSQRGDTLADAYNTGIEASRGDVVAFLSHDDLWMPRKLELQLSRLADAEAFLDGEPPPGFRPELLRHARPVRIMEALAARRSLFDRVGGLRAEVSPADDVDWFARVQDAGVEVAVLPHTLLRKRVHAGSTAHTQPAPLTQLLRASIERRRIAVIVPVHDGERYLEPALRSLLEQTRPPDELIVVDNGSRDRSAAIAEALGARVLRQANLGPAVARNVGARAARAGLLGFLDADDLAMPRRLERQAAALGPGVDAVIGQVEAFAEPGAEHYGFAAGVRAGYNPGALLIRREAFEALGGFDESLGLAEVVDFFARLRDLRLRMLDEVVLRRRIHGANSTLSDPTLHAGYLEAARRAIVRRRA
jgi:glycosyltransferase involved in cell wall biosynthesis